MFFGRVMRCEVLGGSSRTYLSFLPQMAPIQAAILPLMKKPGLIDVAKRLWGGLRYDFDVVYEERGSIGKRYARQDLVGTPFCITVDFDTLEDDHVTVRDRDTAEQVRIPFSDVADFLEKRVSLRGLLERFSGLLGDV